METDTKPNVVADKAQLVALLSQEWDAFAAILTAMPEDVFWAPQAPDKWSPAQHLHHLVRSSRITALVLRLPGFVLKWQWGTPNRPSRTYTQLSQRYEERLAQVPPNMPNRFGPKVTRAATTQAELLQTWGREKGRMLRLLAGWPEAKMDRYLVGHPLLGRVTVRELFMFTAYHTHHHHALVQARSK
jgi:hypothetical protein